MSLDPIVDLFTRALSAPVGQAEPMLFRKGKILTFNQATLQNTILVDGVAFTDLPVLGVAEAASLTAGSVVGLMCVANSWCILGRLVKPNTAEATDAITQVAQGIVSASVATLETTTSGSYTDLATAGPAVTVNIRKSGKALVVVTAGILGQPSNATINTAVMSYDISGATTRAPVAGTTPSVFNQFKSAAGAGDESDTRMSAVALEETLNPGSTTFTAKYRAAGNGETARFSGRNITVFAL